MRVHLNPLELSSYGISLEGARAALAATNANRPKGQLTNGGKTWEIYTNDQIHKADEYKNLVVAYLPGRAVLLKDVADVQDSVDKCAPAGS